MPRDSTVTTAVVLADRSIRSVISVLGGTHGSWQMAGMGRKPTTYWEYIKTEELLSLQSGLADDDAGLSNDEVLFITVHQIDELWFKLVLRELVSVRDLFAVAPVPEQALASATRGLHRIELLFKQLASHFELMETMTTRDYLAFREKLSPASGFQSVQMREMEVLLGLDEKKRIALGHEGSYKRALHHPDGSPTKSSEQLEKRLADTPSLRDAIDDWLHRTPIQGSTPSDQGDEAVVRSFLEAYLDAHASETDRASTYAQHDALDEKDVARLAERYEKERASARHFLFAEAIEDPAERTRRSRIRAALVFLESYRELPLLAWPREIVDALVSLEQAMLIFRQRHARMVERVIGRRTGTGGSAGVDYLDRTALTYRVFDDIWAVRTLQLREAALPPLENASFYGLVAET